MPNDTALAREQLRPYVEMPAFRQYVKDQILEWEVWHRSHKEEINEYEGLRDKLHQELKELQGRDFRHSDDPADFDPLGHAETCYENCRDIAAGLKDDPEYKLVADREPVLFKEASVASIVALFWCDVNDSTLLVPEYDFLGPEGPFIEYLREQWEKPIQERYKHIDWYVEAAINAYQSRIDDGSVMPSSARLIEQKDNDSGVAPDNLKQTTKERDAAFDEAILGYANSDWKRDKTINNKAWRVRNDKQKGEIFGTDANQRGWYRSEEGVKVIKKDSKGAWVYLTASHSEELKKFFSAFVA